MEAGPQVRTVTRGRVVQIEPEAERTACILSRGSRVLVSSFLGPLIRPGDEIDFPIAVDSAGCGTELYVHKASSSVRSHDVYQAPIGYSAQPKSDKRGRLYVRAEVAQGRLGIAALHFPCDVLRDYFYVGDRRRPWDKQADLYRVLGVPSSALLAELRLAYKLRELELGADGAPHAAFRAAERAFNVLAHPELRACHDSLLANPLSPALFPYGGFGSIIVSGDRSRDGQTFFARRILAFLPEHRQRRFRAPLRKFEFYSDRALYRDSRRKLEVMVDQSAMPIVWDQTWNQWKHFLGSKVEIQATFVEAGKYRQRRGGWGLIRWETALPSRLAVKLPANTAEQVEAARKTYHRFGQCASAVDRIRKRIEREPVEREDLQRMCWDLGIPSDFDIAQITWRPDYDEFFYRQLCRRARHLYLFREEYIFDLEAGVAVETPQAGHATYLFAKPQSMEQFLAAYIRTTREDIRRNRGNVAEMLGFLGRVIHGASPRAWLTELKSKIGEGVDYAAAGGGA